MSRIADYSNLPEGFAGHNQSAGIRVSADGQFVYASNRGHDSLVVFRVLDQGAHLENFKPSKLKVAHHVILISVKMATICYVLIKCLMI